MNGRVKQIVDLQLKIDSENEKYRALEGTLNEGERALKKRSDTLERNLEQLNLMYHQLVSQKSMMKVDKQVSERKILRLNDKIALLEKNTKESHEKIFKLEQENIILNDKIRDLKLVSDRMTLGPPLIANTKIKKVIKGGGDNIIFRIPPCRKNNSTIPEHIEAEID